MKFCICCCPPPPIQISRDVTVLIIINTPRRRRARRQKTTHAISRTSHKHVRRRGPTPAPARTQKHARPRAATETRSHRPRASPTATHSDLTLLHIVRCTPTLLVRAGRQVGGERRGERAREERARRGREANALRAREVLLLCACALPRTGAPASGGGARHGQEGFGIDTSVSCCLRGVGVQTIEPCSQLDKVSVGPLKRILLLRWRWLRVSSCSSVLERSRRRGLGAGQSEVSEPRVDACAPAAAARPSSEAAGAGAKTR